MSATDVEGMIAEWGSRLFYPKPKRSGRSDELRGRLSGAEVRARVRETLSPRAVQVVVKVSGGGRGMKAIQAHMRYISRQGKDVVGGKGQTLEMEVEDGRRLKGGAAVRELAAEWREAGGVAVPDVSPRREAFNIVLSMPAGTPPEAVLDASRAFAADTFAGHRYLFVLHTDTDDPHVHLLVRAQARDGRRLNPRKADLARWRESFAGRMRERGIEATASRAATRGTARSAIPLWRAKAGERQATAPAARSDRAAAGQIMAQAREAWERLAAALQTSSEGADRDLAVSVRRYVGTVFSEGHLEPSRERLTIGTSRGAERHR